MGLVDRETNNSEFGHYQRKPVVVDTFEWIKNGVVDKSSNRESFLHKMNDSEEFTTNFDVARSSAANV